jgi:hypothetical protein
LPASTSPSLEPTPEFDHDWPSYDRHNPAVQLYFEQVSGL